MQSGKNLLQKTAQVLHDSASGVICLPENPSLDTIAAAAALYLGLSKLGKNVSLACSSDIKSDLFAADKVQPTLTTSGENLVISFPYTDGSTDRIDYFIQANRFNIVVTPGKNHAKLNEKEVTYGYTGGSVDFIITVDATSLRSLGALYQDNQELFKGKKLINIARTLTNTFFGSVNLVYRGISSTSEIVLNLLRSLNCELDKEISTNLYQGLSFATQNFSSPQVTADTFETAAFLMKSGAVKAKEEKIPDAPKKISFERTAARSMDSLESEPTGLEGDNFDDEDEEDEEWLKPKIFRPNPDKLS
ncbi:hypothetical protein A3G67_02295 [Candidatus Roizmanbacteria bacterium RIFCSPLOWO2_12_FULL_40_12]|uniref:DDH domain-containing protein n=1 Tax=Candidatus Roizmanbacteria bacterium RIFCSPLOWO2_01_FULL_40_42 TaxID=1802066 RepID=A0A1F7J4X4_9BACT|nr:MAG: hypothetical protein A2779_01555 [Candidatus Roizmanbacteria bacterium RIFCSPHIGHO2_01_FULL_40_98]OGK29045.1 MAG: hypothetical protein A3C31_02195 [Candidatus Roizmanbacteria bacterium RIFCSPHIGHO2_02_FULL_40_53]OGK29969.1 MAG: hypothetical protein A2W49_00070 [Candidatus Roizmanbacteria bacterium RIFCSPHIGHO2_12_41_18]OGK36300.1 MAG: hypothetical protein A3E69_03640 [Candidatus Roizmanbacteria bacterium RIFCSPHIGHO2_12_FULL_40_130]OGK50672.1 MAG: hypothetical protein A3B50_00650 [Candi